MKTLFWGIFRYSPPEYIDIITKEETVIDQHDHAVTIINEHDFNIYTSYILYGSAHVTLQIIMQLLFTTIAMKLFGEIQVCEHKQKTSYLFTAKDYHIYINLYVCNSVGSILRFGTAICAVLSI